MPSYEDDSSVIYSSSFSSHHNNNNNNNQSINHHHKKSFYSRVVSKESSKPNSSCRVYYCEAAGAVPFVWESQPGTPKHPLFEPSSASLLVPPLTPPPSYSAAAGKRRDRPRLDHLVSSILPSRRRWSRGSSSSFSSASLSSLSSSWSSSSGSKAAEFSDGGHDRDGDSGEIPASSSPTSTLCFPAAVKKTALRFVSGCYANVKKINY